MFSDYPYPCGHGGVQQVLRVKDKGYVTTNPTFAHFWYMLYYSTKMLLPGFAVLQKDCTRLLFRVI